jgi:hypothetical protein
VVHGIHLQEVVNFSSIALSLFLAKIKDSIPDMLIGFI